jgi:hypothetical protein
VKTRTTNWRPRHGSPRRTGQGAQLGKPVLELVHRPGEGVQDRGVGGAVELPLGRAQHERDRGQSLLGAVVQVALDPSARVVAGLHDPRARLSELGLGGLAVGDVAEVAGERRWAGDVDARDPQLDRNDRAVRAHGRDFQAAVQQPRLLGRQVARQAVSVALTQIGRSRSARR